MHIFRSLIINAEISQVWKEVRNFDGVAQWNPSVVSAKMEIGAPTSVGAIRKLGIADGTVYRETLLAHSDAEYFYTYNIITSPLPVNDYISTHRFIPITHTSQTLGVWESRFTCSPEVSFEMNKVIGDTIYIGGMTGLNQFLKEIKND